MQPAEISLSVVLLGEARELLSVLRRNRRFGYLLSFTAASQPAEHPLVKEVKSLRDIVRSPPTSSQSVPPTSPLLVPPPVLLNALEPFLEVVRSHDASGIITGVALHSLDRIVNQLLSLAATRHVLPPFAPALVAVVDAAAACRFDATDPAADEVVLAGITRLLARIVTSSALPLLPDAAILRAVEACLGIAAGRRRASDLLKRTADSALVEMFRALGQYVTVISHTSGSRDTMKKAERRSPPAVVANGISGSVFGYSLDTDSFSQHGPASTHVLAAALELCARMTDPAVARSHAERSLGMQLMTAMLGSGGGALRRVPDLKTLLVVNSARAILRSLGLFQSQPAIISAAFSISIMLVHVLEEDGAAFLLALLNSVYPYYISGYQNMLPQVQRETDFGSVSEDANGKVGGFGPSAGSSNGNMELGAVVIDPVIREIGLESLAALLSTPGLLCVVYRLADCDLRAVDVVSPLFKALGFASKTKRSRRRSKRLRASSGGSGRGSNSALDADSEDDETVLAGGSGNPEASRFARAASLLCAETILAVVDTINERLEAQSDGSVLKPTDSDGRLLRLTREIRQQKRKLQHAAGLFNSSEKYEKATKLLALLKEQGLAKTSANVSGTVSQDFDEDVTALVRFLRETPGLNKERVGVILGEPDNLSGRVLSEYTNTMHFENRAFIESLRLFLESFRLPGESQKIDRILQSFANRYYEQNKPREFRQKAAENLKDKEGEIPIAAGDADVLEISSQNDRKTRGQERGAEKMNDNVDEQSLSMRVLKSADAAYVLSFSAIMLNTDHYNNSIKKKMTLEDFIRNNRKINAGSDVPRWFLADIYSSIATVEIRMSDEAGIGALTDLLWDEQIKHLAKVYGTLPKVSESREFEEELFLLVWEPAVVAANAILHEAGEANSVQKALEGFLAVARCATAYRQGRPTDAVISSLITATTLREGPLHGAITRFGMDIKAQMACVALSGVSEQCADWLESEGWQSLVSYLLRLHALCLLPVRVEQQIGTNGAEIVGTERGHLQTSKLIPAWWPSQGDTPDRGRSSAEKSRKSLRPNGFFAAIIAASIGSEMESEDEEDYNYSQTSNKKSHLIRRVSHNPPHYLRMRNSEESEAQELARKCIASCRIGDIVINEAKVLQSSALEHLSKGIARSAFRIMDCRKEQSRAVDDVEKDRSFAEGFPLLNWAEIAPSSPRSESSVIAGVVSERGSGTSVESESDFSSFGLSSMWTGRMREKDERKARDFVVAFCIDVLCELTLQNRDRLLLPWPSLHALLVRIIAPATEPSAVLERAVVSLLRIGVRLLHRSEIRDDVLRGLNLLVRLPQDTAEVLSVPVVAGVFNIVKAHGTGIQSTSGWHAILSIAENSARYQPEAREIGLETICCLLREQSLPNAVSSETFTPLLHAILAYTSCTSVETSIRALDLLYNLSQRIRTFSKERNIDSEGMSEAVSSDITNANEMWSEFWGPLFLGFASSVRDARGKVRNTALGILEKVVASGGSAEFLSGEQWARALSMVLLPLMSQLFTTRGFLEATLEAEQSAQKQLLAEKNLTGSAGRNRSRILSTSLEHQEQLKKSVIAACNRTRIRAVTLTSKTFLLHHMTIAAGIPEDTFTELWIGVLEVFRLAVQRVSGESDDFEEILDKHDDLAEHVPESVKNMVLVMCDCGLLKSEQHVRWNATFAVIRKFVPGIEETIRAATGDPVMAKATEAESATDDVPQVDGSKDVCGAENEAAEVDRHNDDKSIVEESDIELNKTNAQTPVPVVMSL